MDENRLRREGRFWDSYAPRYDSFMERVGPAYSRLIEKIKGRMEPDYTVLEIASGTGLVSVEVASRVKQYYGVDISPNMVEIARKKATGRNLANINFQVGDAYQLDFGENTFDAVLTPNVLHVLMDPARVLAGIRGVLKLDGLLIAATYCHGESMYTRAVSFFMGLAGFKAFQKWSVRSYQAFIEKNGFRIIEETIIEDTMPLCYVVAVKN